MADQLRRRMGSLEAYATLIGILIGAGIFKVTGDASAATGPGVVVAHLVLAPFVLASTVAYAVFLSTPLGRQPGGEALHLVHTFHAPSLGFVAAWLKLVSYLGAGAYLAIALVEQLAALFDATLEGWVLRGAALALVALFLALHLVGVQVFARLQVAMCGLLAVSLLVLIGPGLFAIEADNLRPLLPRGPEGLLAALPPLFFAYAGFESLAQTAGEVEDSTRRLPRVFLRGVFLTTLIFVAMTLVAFGTTSLGDLERSATPMTDAARTFLPGGADAIVTLGAVMAIATSFNATMLVPARLSYGLAQEGLMPRVFGRVHATTSVPHVGVLVSFGLVAALIASGRTGLALGIAVLALVLLYGLHSLALVCVSRTNPELLASSETTIPRGVQVAAGLASALAMGGLVVTQVHGDLDRPFLEAGSGLLVVWGALGALLYLVGRRR